MGEVSSTISHQEKLIRTQFSGLLESDGFVKEPLINSGMLRHSGEPTVEAPCRRHASACQGEATKTVGSPESPFGRGLSGATAALSRLARVSAIPCARRLALTPDRLPRSNSRIDQRFLNYFTRILEQVEPNGKYLEDVDFRGITEFTISYSDFGPYSKQAAEMYISGRVRKTVFHVADELQYGMARLFASSTGLDDSYFEFIRHDNNS